MATSLEKLVVSLEAESARYQRELSAARKQLSTFEKQASASASRVSESTQAMVAAAGRAAGALGVAFSVRQVAQWADSYTNLQNRLKLVTDGHQQLARASDDVYAIAQRTRTGLADVGDLYFKIAQSADRLKISQDEVGRATESFAKLLATSGAGAVQASAAILQFSQAVGSGILAGDEFRGVAEAAPAYLDALAESTGFAREELKKLGSEGRLTADLLIKALLDQAATIDEKYGETSSTIDQSLTRVNNAFINLTGSLEKSTGVFAGIAGAINAIADALDRIPSAAKQASEQLDMFAPPQFGGVAGLGGASVDLIDAALRAARGAMAGPPPIQTGMSIAPPALDPEGMSTGGISYGGYTLQQILAMEDANEKLAEAAKKQAKASAAGAAAIRSKMEALEAEAATFNMTSGEATLYELALDGATASQIEHASSLVDQIAQMEKERDLREENEQLLEQYRPLLSALSDEQYAYAETIKDLNQLLAAGVIKQDDYARAAEKAGENLDTYANAIRKLNEELAGDLRETGKNFISDMITDWDNWEDHVTNALKRVADAFADHAAEMAIQAAFGTAGSSGGGGFNWGGLVGKLFGGLAGGYAGGTIGGGDFGTFTGEPGTGGIAPDGLYDHTFAAGGIMPAREWSLVGENGPELVMSHNPARVFNNDDTMDMLGGRGGNQLTQIFNVKDFDSFHKNKRQMRREGQAALGIG